MIQEDIPGKETLEPGPPGQWQGCREVWDRLERHQRVLRIGQVITSEMERDLLFEVIMAQTNEAIGTERSTVFLHDARKKQLWSLVATGMERKEIRIPEDYGVAGWVFQNRTPVIVNNAYEDPRFYAEVDRLSGFRTRNILAIPLISRRGACMGVLQALNRASRAFSEEDRELMEAISHYVAVALDNSALYEELRALNRAKERVMNHLSHELKTPLALIDGALVRISKETAKAGLSGLERPLERGRRNVRRLMVLQDEMDDILARREPRARATVLKLVEEAANLIEERGEEETGGAQRVVEAVRRRLDALFSISPFKSEPIPVDRFLRRLYEKVTGEAGERDLKVLVRCEVGLYIETDPRMLDKVCTGLFRNAIENTPDEGAIEIRGRLDGESVLIEFRDTGVGIGLADQALIFGGFFPTQDTSVYSTKTPYAFNAGGAGADLLRAKVFSERYGFEIGFESLRCCFLPSDTDLCGGKVSACPHVKDDKGCREAGGSLFWLRFPLGPREPGTPGT